jgi:hypothetical protein
MLSQVGMTDTQTPFFYGMSDNAGKWAGRC